MSTYLDLDGGGDVPAVHPHADYNIAGDLEVIARVSFDDLTPLGDMSIVCRNATVGHYWDFLLDTTGVLSLKHSSDGDLWDDFFDESTVLLNTVASAGVFVWVKVVLDVDNGASGHDILFYYSNDNTDDESAVTWTQLGTTITTAGLGTLGTGSAAQGIALGASQGVGNFLEGKIRRAIVRDGIGGAEIFNVDATNRPLDTTGFLEDSTTEAYVSLRASAKMGGTFTPGTWLTLDADASTLMHAPDPAWMAGATNFTYEAKINLLNYDTPGRIGLVSQYLVAVNQAFYLEIDTTSQIRLFLNQFGTGADETVVSTVGLGGVATNDEDCWIRAIFTGGVDAAFAYSLDSTNDPDEVSWSALGTPVVVGTPSLFNSVELLELFALKYGKFVGNAYRVRMSVDGTVELDLDLTRLPLDTTSIIEDSANAQVITLEGNAVMAGEYIPYLYPNQGGSRFATQEALRPNWYPNIGNKAWTT